MKWLGVGLSEYTLLPSHYSEIIDELIEEEAQSYKAGRSRGDSDAVMGI